METRPSIYPLHTTHRYSLTRLRYVGEKSALLDARLQKLNVLIFQFFALSIVTNVSMMYDFSLVFKLTAYSFVGSDPLRNITKILGTTLRSDPSPTLQWIIACRTLQSKCLCIKSLSRKQCGSLHLQHGAAFLHPRMYST